MAKTSADTRPGQIGVIAVLGVVLLIGGVVVALGRVFLPEKVAAADVPEGQPRIAALLPFAADQLIAMGVTPVAVPTLRGGVPEAWDGITQIAVEHSAGPNLEQLIAVEPDVVVTSSVYAQFIPALEQNTGARVVAMDVDSIESVADHIRMLGELAQRTADADSYALEYVSLASGRAPEGAPVSVLAIMGTPHAFFAFLPDTYLGDLIEHAGGRLVTDDMRSHRVFRGLAPLSMEAVIDRDPELIIVIFHGPEESARAMLKRDPLWSSLSAVESGSVVFLSDDLYAMRSGSELARAMQEIEDAVGGVRAP